MPADKSGGWPGIQKIKIQYGRNDCETTLVAAGARCLYYL
jgi:hypothetical protein